MNVAASVSATVTGSHDTINIGDHSNVTVNGNSHTVIGHANDQIALNGGFDVATVAANDPLIVNGSFNSIDLSGEGIKAGDTSSSSGNFFAADGDGVITLVGANETVFENGGNETITRWRRQPAMISRRGYWVIRTSPLSFSNTVTDTFNATLELVTITFDGQSIAGNVLQGTETPSGLTYALSGRTLTLTDGSDTLTLQDFITGDYGVNISANANQPLRAPADSQ